MSDRHNAGATSDLTEDHAHPTEPAPWPLRNTRRVLRTITATGLVSFLIGLVWYLALAAPGPTLIFFATTGLLWYALDLGCELWASRADQRGSHQQRDTSASLRTAAPDLIDRRNGTRP